MFLVIESHAQGSAVSLISLNLLEFRQLFSRPGNSLYLAVFIKMSLNPLENVNSLKASNVLLCWSGEILFVGV